jgi:hypothetical protein
VGYPPTGVGGSNNVGGMNGIVGWFLNHISDETALVVG